MAPYWGKQILHLVPSQNLFFFCFYKNHYKSKKRIDFEMGPSVKFVSPNKGIISEEKKLGVNFFRRKNDQTRGGSEGGLAKDHTFSNFFFLNPSLTIHSKYIVYISN